MRFIGKSRHRFSKGHAPLLIAHGTVVLPHVLCTLSLSTQDKVLFSQDPAPTEIIVAYPVEKSGLGVYGVIAKVVQIIKSSTDPQFVILDGVAKVRLGELSHKDQLIPSIEYFVCCDLDISQKQYLDLNKNLRKIWTDYAAATESNTQICIIVSKSYTLTELMYRILAFISTLTIEQKVDIFLNSNLKEMVLFLVDTMQTMTQVLELRKDLDSRVRRKMVRNQREYYLQEQMKEIQKELGDSRSDLLGVKEFEERFAKIELSSEVSEKYHKEMRHYMRLQPFSPEAGMLRVYLETLLDLPWGINMEDKVSLEEAQEILNQKHYGLEKIKERVLDFLAVRKIFGGHKSPILCFLGPPGVGKTSLASSIATCLGRKFVRLSLGGINDESEIRGHRRTYIGALPGKIIQTLQSIKTSNPVFLLDEIDKISCDSRRGNPASALLEVLDSEQNTFFKDTYLEVPYDLSQVLFIATANSLNGIPYPLLDRLDILELSGYTELEKIRIAENFIIPKKIEESGLEGSQLLFTKDALQTIIRCYTNESGVRQLEREIGHVICKVVRQGLSKGVLECKPNQKIDYQLETDEILKILGTMRNQPEDFVTPLNIGTAIGLAWSELGGRVFIIEVKLFPGKGELLMTGTLGQIMKESAQIAMSFLRGYCTKLGIKKDIYQKHDIHIHIPEGATPKDGPSAGIALATAIYSAICGRAPLAGTAMTGEITLAGHLLPIGGLREKTLAASRHKIDTILIPSSNLRDFEDLPFEVKEQIKFVSFGHADEALNYLFG